MHNFFNVHNVYPRIEFEIKIITTFFNDSFLELNFKTKDFVCKLDKNL